MKRILLTALPLIIFLGQVAGQVKFQTTAEKTDYKSTSNYNDVMTFISQLTKSSKLVRVEKMATSVEGMEVPLLVIGNPLPATPSDLRNDKRIVVYVQANIHAGEVEGKEATLMFARDLLSEKSPALLKDVVLLICPNFNPDGNEKISPQNRTYQNGPVNGVGVRYDGMYLDLNRDAMKAESPEVRGLISNVFDKWDPAVFMDCHTTDGSYHVEPVTFTWMVNPAGDESLIDYRRTRMVPEMSKTLLGKYKVENCFYGEFNDMMKPESGWFYDAAEPRYICNYFGLRNRLGILNENYVYADFKSRVWGCYYLIKSLADYVTIHKDEIKSMVREADARTVARGLNPAVTDSFPVEYKVRPLPEKVLVKTFEPEVVTDANGRRRMQPGNREKDLYLPYFIDYYPVKNVKFPFAYLLTVSDPAAVSLLKLHGIRLEKLASETSFEAEHFEIKELKGASRLNQGHYTNTVTGRYVSAATSFPTGTIVVRTAQPLASLAAYLLEPQANDGLMYWNFLDRYLVPQWGGGYYPYPVYRIINKTELKTVPY